MDLTPGRMLPNGATLIMGRKLTDKPGNYASAIVMAYNKEGAEFVTWMLVDGQDGEFCTNGWYQKDVEDAIGDYLFRFDRLEGKAKWNVTQAAVRAERRARTA